MKIIFLAPDSYVKDINSILKINKKLLMIIKLLMIMIMIVTFIASQ